MEPWRKDLRRGGVICCVLHPSTSAAAFRPRRLSQLSRPNRVADLNQTGRGEFAEPYRDFVESRAEQASYDARSLHHPGQVWCPDPVPGVVHSRLPSAARSVNEALWRKA